MAKRKNGSAALARNDFPAEAPVQEMAHATTGTYNYTIRYRDSYLLSGVQDTVLVSINDLVSKVEKIAGVKLLR